MNENDHLENNCFCLLTSAHILLFEVYYLFYIETQITDEGDDEFSRFFVKEDVFLNTNRSLPLNNNVCIYV